MRNLFFILFILFFSCRIYSQCTVAVSASSGTICQYSNLMLNAYGNGINKYLWSPGNYTTSFVNASPSVTTTYTVIGYNYSGTTVVCSDTNTVTIYVVPFPNLNVTSSGTIVCSGDSALIFANGVQHCIWAPGSYTTQSIWAKPSATTNYTIMGWNSLGNMNCNVTKEITIIVDQCTGINGLKNNNSELTVFPNPFLEKLNIDAIGEAEVIIYNNLGKTLIQKNFINSVEIQTLNFESGIYFISIKNKEGSKILKLLRN